MSKPLLFLVVFLGLLAGYPGGHFFVNAATSGYAWANNAGWLNFGCTYCNVQVTDSAITGYAWNENFGWIDLNPSTSGVKNTAGGVLSGNAWGENTGWINFSGVTINCSGELVGTATGDIIGTVSFDCSNCNVVTSWVRSIGCGGGPGQSHNECNAQKQCISVSGSGTNQCSTSDDCLTHNVCDSQNQCVSASGAGSDQCSTNSDCAVTHTECNTLLCVSIAGLGANQCNSDNDCQIPKHNECNFQKQCVSVSGVGSNQCLTSSDCAGTFPEPGPGPTPAPSSGGGTGVGWSPSHNECNAQKQCVSVLGSGTDKCQASKDCIKEEVVTPAETIIKVVEQLPEPVQIVAEQTKKIIETPQGSVISKTVSTAGFVVATAVAATSVFSFSLFEIFLIPLRLFSLLLTALGIKKRVLPWGLVYDSITKQPLDPAYVYLKNIQNGKVLSAITDLDGRYGFLVGPGVYQMQARKTNYIFPSQKLVGKLSDELHTNLYFGENIEVKAPEEVIVKNIPLDPIKFDWNEFAKKSKNLMRFYSKWDVVIRRASDFIFAIGFIVAVVAYIFAPYFYNIIIITLYVVLFLLRFVGFKPKTYGYIRDRATGNPLSFAIIRVMVPGSGAQTVGGVGPSLAYLDREITSKSADKYGKYYCLVPPGKYYIKIEKKNGDGSYSLVYTSPVIDVSRKGIIKERFDV